MIVVAFTEPPLNAKRVNPVVEIAFAKYDMHSALPPEVEVIVIVGAAANELGNVTAKFPTTLFAVIFPTAIVPSTILIGACAAKVEIPFCE